MTIDILLYPVPVIVLLRVRAYLNEPNYTTKNMQVVADLQTSCNKVVVKPMSEWVCTSCNVVKANSDLLQVLIMTVRKKLL